MSITYPTSLDSFTNPTSSDTLLSIDHATQHSNANDAIEALELKVGITGSADTSSLDYRTSRLTTKGAILTSNWSNLVSLPAWTDWYMLVTDSTASSGLKYIATTSGGTVTTASVVSANWFAWTVATATTTPAITLTTSITGVLKWNGTAISAASAWTDYLTPSGDWSALTWVLPSGMISPYAWSSAPTWWLLANGAAVSRTTYSALFTAISTTYGVGDWSTTFNLPDLTGRIPVGKNAGTFVTLGSTWGAETHTLTEAQMPAHSHGTLSYSGGWVNSGNISTWSGVQITGTYATTSSNGYNVTETKWSGTAHNNLQPYLTINYIIKT